MKEQACDSKSTVTVLSQAAVTLLFVYCQRFIYQQVTDDSKFLFFKVLRHFRGSQICYMPLSMAYARLFEGINIQCYKIKMELKKM